MVTEYREAVEMELVEARSEYAMASAAQTQNYLNTSMTGTLTSKSGGKTLLGASSNYSHGDI